MAQVEERLTDKHEVEFKPQEHKYSLSIYENLLSSFQIGFVKDAV
jgi:hypothetical protein